MPIRIPVKADVDLRKAFEDIELRLQDIERGMNDDALSKLKMLAKDVRELQDRPYFPEGNDEVDTNDELLSSAYSVRCSKSSTQSIANNTLTEVTWQTEEYDDGGFFDGGVSTTEFTIPVAGTYLICASFRYDTVTADARMTAQIFIDGVVATASESTANAGAASFSGHSMNWMGDLNVGQVVTIEAFQLSGSAVNIRTQEAWVAIKKIGTN